MRGRRPHRSAMKAAGSRQYRARRRQALHVGGRGFVEITGRRNYADWSKRLGMDLIANPALAEKAGNCRQDTRRRHDKAEPSPGKSLPGPVNEKRTDYLNARRVVQQHRQGADDRQPCRRMRGCAEGRGIRRRKARGARQAISAPPAPEGQMPPTMAWQSGAFANHLEIIRLLGKLLKAGRRSQDTASMMFLPRSLPAKPERQVVGRNHSSCVSAPPDIVKGCRDSLPY